MNNYTKSLANGDFEVVPLDDPQFLDSIQMRNYALKKMKTNQQKETEAILFMGKRLDHLEEQLQSAMERCNTLMKLLEQSQSRVRELESQIYGGSTQ